MAASMVRWLRGLYVFFLTCLFSVFAFLNLEELNEMKYGIQILSDPVIMGQAQSEDVMLVSSKFKQRYECRLPAQALLFQPHSPSEAPPTSANSYSGPTISELLQPMSNAPCLIKTKDWWTYEFCYGKHIRQYHLEDSEIKGDVLFLGYYSSEFDWTNETAKASKQHRLRRYHSQAYTNGSKCDLNGNPRETEVRFACEEGSVDYIARVDEPQSCRYVVTIHTSRPCSHPFLRPPPSTRPQPIICQPALSPQQYMDYVKAQVSDTKRKVEQISEELKTLDEILSKDEGTDADGAAEMTEATVESIDTETTEFQPEENNILESESKPVDQPEDPEAQPVAEDVSQGDQLQDNEVFGEEKFNFRIISDPADLMKFVQHLRESSQRSESEEEDDEQPALKEKTGAKEGRGGAGDTKEEEGDEDERLLQEFEEEMADVSIPAEKRKEIKEEMQKEFSNIIDEAQQELESEGLKGEFDRSQATHTLENTLDKLLDRLQDKGDEEPTPTHTHTHTHSHSHTQTQTHTHSQTPAEDQTDQTDPQTTEKEKHPDPASRVPKHPGKIEVKILSRKTVEEAGDQWLSEEDTKSFRELLINLLTGGTEEVYKEQKRQQELEDNYKFVWGGEQPDDSQSAASSDGQTTVVADTDDLEL
ncbi:protein OS-9 isoform X2 [Alosa sapidissima]|uniref:protein OS-9 isoform X2 n=1 Tax=Alosa sapidissima TaxID=34773 RepID=UPI001C084ED5|nr:protein OS-9 isoform X2 [Alosa sapidissima]